MVAYVKITFILMH